MPLNNLADVLNLHAYASSVSELALDEVLHVEVLHQSVAALSGQVPEENLLVFLGTALHR